VPIVSVPVERLAYSPTEAAQALGVCRQTIYRLLEAEQLRSFKVGSRRVIPASDLLQLVGGDDR
jgi:excisionase family DNA binding protein